jgi:hypothetical protein
MKSNKAFNIGIKLRQCEKKRIRQLVSNLNDKRKEGAIKRMV